MSDQDQIIPGVHDDPNTWYLPQGDVPDLTEAEYGEAHESVDTMCYKPFDMGQGVTVVCTRPKKHDGSHVAGDSDRIVVLWDIPAYRISEEPV